MDNYKLYLATRESSLEDPEYRYKVDRPQIRITGKDGNKFTWFENSDYYVSILGLPSILFGKHIGNKLSCPTYYDNEQKCIKWKGEYNEDMITEYLMDFAKTYNICSNCDLPELSLTLDSKKNITTVCRACGENNKISVKNKSELWYKTYENIQKHLKK